MDLMVLQPEIRGCLAVRERFSDRSRKCELAPASADHGDGAVSQAAYYQIAGTRKSFGLVRRATESWKQVRFTQVPTPGKGSRPVISAPERCVTGRLFHSLGRCARFPPRRPSAQSRAPMRLARVSGP